MRPHPASVVRVEERSAWRAGGFGADHAPARNACAGWSSVGVIRDTVAIILRFAVVPRFGRPGLMFLQENNRAPLKARA
jgi:hypothetical protein